MSTGLAVHFSSARDDWATPQALFDELDAEFGFTLDVCATRASAKCDLWFEKEQDALTCDWSGVCWMNPPYGRGIARWVRKARASAVAGSTVVCLLPARTDTAWWHEHIWDADSHEPRPRVEVRFIPGRIRFNDDPDPRARAPFPSAIVIFRAAPVTHEEQR